MSTRPALTIGKNIVFTAYNWWQPIGGSDPNGAPRLVGVTPETTATATLTSTGVNVSENDTVTIGIITYRFKATPVQAYDVDIGASAAASLDNLKAAVNDSGTPGTEYFAGTLKNQDASATTNTDTTQLFVARVSGLNGNAIVSTTTAVTLSFGGTTFTGGTASALKVSGAISEALPAGDNNIGNVDVASLPASETHIGQVGGHAAAIQATLNGATPTIAAAGDYAAGDVLSENATTGHAFLFPAAARVAAGSGVIVRANINFSVEGLVPRFRLWLFNALPTASNLNDNVAFSLDADDRTKVIGYFDFPALTDQGEVSYGQNLDVRIGFKLPAGVDIYGILQTLDAFTNETAGMTARLELGIIQD